MKVSDYTKWMKQAFLGVEAALAQELVSPARVTMSEDYFRSAFTRALATSWPENARRVDTEGNVWWNENECWIGSGMKPGQGSKLRHDISVAAADNDKGMACEVKWLKQQKAESIAGDILKLWLSRGIGTEGQSVRTYLLIGGEFKAFSGTMNSLKNAGFNLRWSETKNGKTPEPTSINLEKMLSKGYQKMAGKQLLKLIGWGSNPIVYRSPPPCWSHICCTVRAKWIRRVDPIREQDENTSWRAVLWELHHRSADSQAQIDWNVVSEQLNVRPVTQNT